MKIKKNQFVIITNCNYYKRYRFSKSFHFKGIPSEDNPFENREPIKQILIRNPY